MAWVASPGSYAEQVLVQAEKAVPVPDGVSDELAVAAALQGMTAHYLCTSTYPVEEGDTVSTPPRAAWVICSCRWSSCEEDA